MLRLVAYNSILSRARASLPSISCVISDVGGTERYREAHLTLVDLQYVHTRSGRAAGRRARYFRTLLYRLRMIVKLLVPLP